MTAPSDLLTLPEGWVWTKIGDVLDVFSGYGFPKKYQGKLEGDIPFFKVGDISKTVLGGNMYLRIAENYISFAECEEIKAQPLKEGTIVFAKIGEAIKLNRRAILGQQSLVDNNVMGVCNFSNGLNNLFIYYFFRTIKLGDYSRATTVPSVRKADIENIAFPLPPLPEQHRVITKIEELFTKLDAGVKSLEKTKAQLKRYRQSVLKHAFEGKLTEEWRERHKDELEPVSVLLERIKEERKKNVKGKYKELPPLDTSDLPELPEGWVLAKVGEICVTTSGGTPSRKNKRYYGGTIPWLKSGELENKIITSTEEYITEVGLENSSAKIIPAGTLLMALYGATVGKLGILGIDSAINQAICAIFAPSQLAKKYLFWYLMDYRNELLNSRIGGAQPNISQTIVNKVTLPFPSLPEQHKIVEEIERRFSLTDEVERSADQSLKQAERLRQSILKRAFEGKLVPQDPSDEPASVLLERIKEEKAKREAEQKVKKRKKKMKSVEKKGTKKLYEILKSAKKPLTPNELWKLSKLNSVEFYEELNKEVEGGKIVEKRMKNNHVFLEVKK